MKYVIFFLLVFSIGGLYYAAKTLPRASYDRLYDVGEHAIYEMGGNPVSRFLENKAKPALGYCESSTSDAKAALGWGETGTAVAISQNFKVLADQRIPFTIPFRLKDFSVLCLYPASPKTFMIQGDAGIALRREFDAPPILQVLSGKVQVASENLNLILRTKGMNVSLVSDGPSRIGVFEEEARTTLFVLFGKINFSYSMIPKAVANPPLHILLSSEGSISMAGKPLPMKDNLAVLMPSGFLEIPPEAVPPVPAASPVLMPSATSVSTATGTAITVLPMSATTPEIKK